MKAKVQYGDFAGTVSADISDQLGGNSLAEVADYFKLDQDRFRIVGISINGTDDMDVDLRCVDLQRSTPEKEFIVDLNVDLSNKENVLDFLFKRLHISLHGRFDEKYLDPELESDAEGVLGEY